MKVVFDTNVLIAALIAHGTSAQVFEHVLSSHDPAIGVFILEEVQGKLTQKFGYSAEHAENVASFLRRRLRFVEAVPLASPACRDPDDDNVLAVAKAADADVLITGDGDLLDLEEYDGIAIIQPGQFWEFERKRAKDPSA